MKKLIIPLCMFFISVSACTMPDTTVDKNKLLGNDYRLFQETPAWDLAQAVENGDTREIKAIVVKDKQLLNFREPRFGQPLLTLAVLQQNYKSTVTLLELGADPNMQDFYDGKTPLMNAAETGYGDKGTEARFVKILLDYKADPNIVQKGPNASGFTALTLACGKGNLEYVKLIVEAHANINMGELGTTPLFFAAISRNPDLVIYLISKGADYTRVLYQTEPEYENKYLTHSLREWRFKIGSRDYEKKMLIVDFLKRHGMDYRKTKIPQEFLDQYPKDYLDKY